MFDWSAFALFLSPLRNSFNSMSSPKKVNCNRLFTLSTSCRSWLTSPLVRAVVRRNQCLSTCFLPVNKYFTFENSCILFWEPSCVAPIFDADVIRSSLFLKCFRSRSASKSPCFEATSRFKDDSDLLRLPKSRIICYVYVSCLPISNTWLYS